MSKVLLCSTKNGKTFAVTVEPEKVKIAYRDIKEDLPGVSIGVYGARDLVTLKRAQRTLKPENIVESVPELVRTVKSVSSKSELV